ncbi:MAG: hypothetical protein HY738_01845 [Bacteroidia bacterium]|nr:hypothetical protein [Bacteroidia bacterium]
MMRHFITYIIFLLIPCLHAQQPVFDWVKSAGGASYDGGYSLYYNENLAIIGMYNYIPYFNGYTLPNSGYWSSIFICVMDNNGNYINVKSLGSNTTMSTGWALNTAIVQSWIIILYTATVTMTRFSVS